MNSNQNNWTGAGDTPQSSHDEFREDRRDTTPQQHSIAGDGFVMRDSSGEAPAADSSSFSTDNTGESGFYAHTHGEDSPSSPWQRPSVAHDPTSSTWQDQPQTYPPQYQTQQPPYGGSAPYGTYQQPGTYAHGYSGSSSWQPQAYTVPDVPPAGTGSSGWQSAHSHSQDKQPSGKKRKGLKVFGVLAGSAAAIGVFALAGVGLYHVLTPDLYTSDVPAASSSAPEDTPVELIPGISIQDVPQTTTTSSANGEIPEGGYSTEDLVEMVRPSVVAISSYSSLSSLQADGIGSGIIIRSDGYIVTNDHVVEDAQSLTVTLSTEAVYEGRVVATDSKTDLAVIKIDADNLPAAVFGNSDQVRIGERVIAIGNPQSMQFYGSVTQGIVSGLGRSVTAASPSGGATTDYSNLIQTDAAINPGNSGGALVNAYGQIIGINSAKVVTTGSEGMGFAIPANEVKEIVDDLINYKRVLGRVRLGITARAIDEVTAQRNNVPVGIYVVSTEEGSDISKQGVLPGDIITAVNGESVTSFSSLNEQLEGKNPGDTVTLSIYRRSELYPGEGKRIEFNVMLLEDMGEMVENTAPQTTNENESDPYDYYQQEPYQYYDLEDFLREYFGQ